MKIALLGLEQSVVVYTIFLKEKYIEVVRVLPEEIEIKTALVKRPRIDGTKQMCIYKQY